jgi:RND family efflux transporter MFP subunit
VKKLAVVSPILILVALAACGRPAPHAGGEAAEGVVRAPLVRAERLASAAAIELTGTVEAERAAALSSRVVAPVTGVHVQLGERVRPGQLLVSIDPAAAEGQAAQAAGALAQARAALALAERNHERFRALAAEDAASELELDFARMQHDQARGAVEQAEGALRAARAVATESRVVAPFAGRVAGRPIEVGDLAAPGRPLVLLESERGRRLVVAVPERLAEAAALAPGARVPVALDALPALERFDGAVVEVSPGPDPVTHAYTVKIALGDVDAAAGASGRAWIPAGERSAVLVPAAAIVRSGGLELVVERDGEGLARARAVTVGEALPDGRVEILSGLRGGEELALGLSAAPRAGTRLESAEGDRP